LAVEVFVEHFFDPSIDRGLGHVDIEFLKCGDANVGGLKLAAQFVQIGEVVG
jgi:hypothetical protein